MATVELRPLPLRVPSQLTTYEIWREKSPQYLVAYTLAFNAENYATRQAEASTTKKAKEIAQKNVMYARVAGYLLVELFDRHEILTEGPCSRLSTDLLSGDREGGDANDVVFRLGQVYRDRFIRLCALHLFHTSFGISISPQFGQPALRTPHPHRTLLVLPSTRWKI